MDGDDPGEALESDGAEVPRALEKFIMLNVIDEKWKDHLREMDDLRQAAQNAVFEQKDPLMVYKFESYELFKRMLLDINTSVISTIFKAGVKGSDSARQDQIKRDDFSNLRTRHDSLEDIERRNQSQMSTNSPEGDNRPMSRRERRQQGRTKKRR